MKKIFLATLTSSLLLLSTITLVKAQTPTPLTDSEISADQEASAETTQKLKERIEKIVEEKKQQIQGAISDLSYTKRGFIGEIQRVTEETLTVKNTKGTQIVPLENKPNLIKKKSPIATDEIAVGDWVTVLGLVENDTFVPKKIYVSPTTLQPKSHLVMLGTIEEISNKTLVFKSRSQETNQELTINSKTEFQDNTGEEALLKDFEESTQALLVGYEDENKKIVTVLRALASFEKE